MKLFFSFFLISSLQARAIIKIDYLANQIESKKFIERHIREQYRMPEKFIEWNKVLECKAQDKGSILHLCLDEDNLKILNSKPELLEKIMTGYLN